MLTLLPDRIQSRIMPVEDGCWLWVHTLMRDGYGLVWMNGKTTVAHRAIYEALVGPISDGLDLDHLCRVRSCVNPEHLEPVTHAENCRRGEGGKETGRQMASKTHCPQGHPYSGANLYVNPKGGRHCRECRRASSKKYAEGKK